MTSFTHAFAHNLIGFKASTLRVRVLGSNDRYVWVITADLLDAGTRIVLDQTQIEPIIEAVYPPFRSPAERAAAKSAQC